MPDSAAAAAAAAAATTAAAVVVAIAETKRELNILKMAADIDYLKEENTTMKQRLDSFDLAANRWKGGFLVMVALGGIIAWLSSVGSSIGRLFK